MHLLVPAALAVVSAVLVACGTLIRQRTSTPSGGITRRWWLGVLVAVVGFTLQAVALGLGTILLVQPLIILSVLFALPMEARLDHRRLSAHEWRWGVILTLCVAAFVLLTMPSAGAGHASPATAAYTAVTVLAVLVAMIAGALFVASHFRSLLFGAASGVLTGVQALLVKVVMDRFSDGVLQPFTHAELYLILLVAFGSVLTQQQAFAAHDLQTSFPAMVAIEPVVAVALGVVLLHERANVTPIQAVVVAVVVVVMLVAVVVLARTAASREQVHERDRDDHEGSTTYEHAA